MYISQGRLIPYTAEHLPYREESFGKLVSVVKRTLLPRLENTLITEAESCLPIDLPCIYLCWFCQNAFILQVGSTEKDTLIKVVDYIFNPFIWVILNEEKSYFSCLLYLKDYQLNKYVFFVHKRFFSKQSRYIQTEIKPWGRKR